MNILESNVREAIENYKFREADLLFKNNEKARRHQGYLVHDVVKALAELAGDMEYPDAVNGAIGLVIDIFREILLNGSALLMRYDNELMAKYGNGLSASEQNVLFKNRIRGALEVMDKAESSKEYNKDSLLFELYAELSDLPLDDKEEE